MHRPIGVTILALLAGLAGLLEVWRTLVFLGIDELHVRRQGRLVHGPQWGQVIWAVLLAADLVLGGGRVLEHPRLRLVVRQLHQPYSR